MGSVEENARSAMDALISELNKERGVSHKYQSINHQLITQLTNKDQLIHSLQIKITHLESLLSAKTIRDSVTDDAAVEFADVSDQRDTTVMEDDDKNSDDDKDAAVEVVDKEEAKKDDSKAVIKSEDETSPKEKASSIWKDHSHEFLVEVIKMIRFTFRGYFGLSFSNRWGFFIDYIMSAKIHSFADWIEYPSGHNVLKGHKNSVYAAVVSTDGYYLFTGGGDKLIFVWDMLTNQDIHHWQAHDRWIYCLDFHSGLLASGGYDGKLCVWNVFDDCELVQTFQGGFTEVYCVNFNRKGNMIVSSDDSNCVRLWSVKEGTCIRVMNEHCKLVINARFLDEMIIGLSTDPSIRVWNPHNGDQIRCIEDGIGDSAIGFSMNCDASLIALFVARKSLSVYTWPEMDELMTVDGKISWICFHPCKPHLIAVADSNGNLVKMYDMNKKEYVVNLEGHSEFVREVHFTPDGSRIISVSLSQYVRVWDISDVV